MRFAMPVPEQGAAHPAAEGRWLAIVGIGEDGVDGLSPAARKLVAGAAVVFGGKRHLALADPIIGLLITIAIFGIVWQSARSVVTQALDGVEPNVTDEIRHVAEHVPSVKIVDARARWHGHRLHTDVAIAVDNALPVSEATRLADQLRGELMGHMPALRTATITFATLDDTDVFEVAARQSG